MHGRPGRAHYLEHYKSCRQSHEEHQDGKNRQDYRGREAPMRITPRLPMFALIPATVAGWLAAASANVLDDEFDVFQYLCAWHASLPCSARPDSSKAEDAVAQHRTLLGWLTS